MKNYIYQGPLSSVTLRDDSTQESNIILSPNNEVTLPEKHEYTQALVAQGFLTEIEQTELITDETKSPKSRAKKEETEHDR